MVEAGDRGPELDDVEFEQAGAKLSLADLRGDRPLVLLFLRHFG